MTSPSLSAIVFTEGLGRSLSVVVECLRLIDPPIELVLLEAEGADRLSSRVVDSLSSSSDIVRVLTTSGSRARQRNVGVGKTSADYLFFVDAGWMPDERFGSVMAEVLDREPEIAFVTSHFLRLDFSGIPKTVFCHGVKLENLLGRVSALHDCTVFRKSLWRELDGFDEALGPRDLDDFFVRAAFSGFRGEVVPEVLALHDAKAAASYRGDLRRGRYLPGVRALYAKHRSSFEEHTASALVEREQQLYELADSYRPLVERRREIVGEHAELEKEIGELKAFLVEHAEPIVDWGDLRRTTPISPEWGMDRGQPVDRYYIESFLDRHADDIRGSVLEVQEDDYTRRFGGDQVEASDVIDLNPSNPRATLVADLRRATDIPSNTYDCFIISQTLHVIDDMKSVLEESYRILKPGGVLLATFPCLSRVCLEYGEDGDFWRLTEAGAMQLVSGVFPIDAISTQVYGNVLVATAFLYGLAVDEVKEEEFESLDPYHPVLIGARAVKPGGADREIAGKAPSLVSAKAKTGRGTILAYHRVASCDVDPHGICLSESEFRAQVKGLADHCQAVSLEDLVEAAAQGDLDPDAVALTFDDGYVDALETAAPILSELGIPATFFVTTEGLARPRAYWWDLLDRVFAVSAGLPTELWLRWRNQERLWQTHSQEDRKSAFEELYHEVLLLSPPAQRDDVLRQLARWSGVDLEPQGQARSMHGDEIRRLAAIDGMTIGAHGIHHLALSKQPFPTQQKEIVESRSCLERLLGREVTCFAYAYGDLDDTAVDLVRAADYSYAVTCVDGRVGRFPIDRFRLPRRTPPRGVGDRFLSWFRHGRPGS